MSQERSTHHCPVCGQLNQCRWAADAATDGAGTDSGAAVAGAAGRGADVNACWCSRVIVDSALSHWLRSFDGGASCLCARCAAGDIPSPCINICQLDDANEYCVGCLRTLDEIGAWAGLDTLGRARVLKRIRERRQPGG